MQLTQLKSFLPGLEQTEIETWIDEAGFLTVWVCDVWPGDEPARSSTYMLVYRSLLVEDTSPIYKPVYDKILAADHSELLREARCDDETMWYGSAKALLIRLHSEGANPPYKASDIRWVIDQMEGAML